MGDSFLAFVLLIAVFAAIGLNTSLSWLFREFKKGSRKVKTLGVTGGAIAALSLQRVVSFAQTSTPTPAPTDVPAVSLEVDMTPLFESLNTYLPTFIGIFAVIGGIGLAIAFARFLINAVKGAFTGGDV